MLLQALKTERNHGPGNAALGSETGKETDYSCRRKHGLANTFTWTY